MVTAFSFDSLTENSIQPSMKSNRLPDYDFLRYGE